MAVLERLGRTIDDHKARMIARLDGRLRNALGR
jgi:hypothetical protein